MHTYTLVLYSLHIIQLQILPLGLLHLVVVVRSTAHQPVAGPTHKVQQKEAESASEQSQNTEQLDNGQVTQRE